MNNVFRKSRPSEAIKVFYSYAHEDEVLKDKLVKHLKIYERLGIIRAWHDRKIIPGQEWSSEINTHLEEADLILLLISADFISSNYCYDFEMARALEKHKSGEAYTIPVILHSCIWNIDPLSKLQALPSGAKAITSWPNENEAFTSVAEGIIAAIDWKFPIAETTTSDRQINRPVVRVEIPTLMPYLCDRMKQEENLEDCLQPAINARSQRPFVCFIHGHEAECLEKYKEKMQEEVLPELFRPINKDDFPVEPIFLLFPNDPKNIQDFIVKLRRELGHRILNNKFATDNDIAESLSRRKSPVMINAYPSIKNWESNGPEIIAAFVNYWNNFPNLPPGPRLITCLFFIYKDEPKDDRMRDYLTGFDFSNYAGVHGTTLQELDVIESDDVKNWFRDNRPFLGFCNNHPAGFCKVQEALDEINDFYKDQETRSPKKGVSMKILAEKVKSILDKKHCQGGV